MEIEAKKLSSMRYRDLQQLAKKNGIKANLRKADMVKQLRTCKKSVSVQSFTMEMEKPERKRL